MEVLRGKKNLLEFHKIEGVHLTSDYGAGILKMNEF